MNKKLLVIILLIVSLIGFGCGSQKTISSSADWAPREESSSQNAAMPGSGDSGAIPPNVNLDLNSLEQKIIKNGEISITVQSNAQAETAVLELVAKYRGLVQNTNTYTSRDTSNTDMVVRIPADDFDAFIGEIKDLGEVTRNFIYTTDVTEEYIDLAARQKTLVLQEERLQEMLKKTNNVDELLKVENELARVRGEIERITGRLTYLDNRISFSTINISLRTKYIPTQAETKNFGGEILFSFQDGIGSFVNLTVYLVKTLVWLLPFLVVGLPVVIFLWRRYYRRREKK